MSALELITKIIISDCEEVNSILESIDPNTINEQDENGFSPLLMAVYEEKYDMVKLIMDYANKKNIILKINDKNKYGYFPLLVAILNNNIKKQT